MRTNKSSATFVVYLLLLVAGIFVSFLALYGIRADASDPWNTEEPEPVELTEQMKGLLNQNAEGAELDFAFLEGKTKKEQLAELEAMKADLEKAKGDKVADEDFEWNVLPTYMSWDWSQREMNMFLENAIENNTTKDFEGWYDKDAEWAKVFLTDKRTTDYNSTQVAPLVGNGKLAWFESFIASVDGSGDEPTLHLYTLVTYYMHLDNDGLPKNNLPDVAYDWDFPEGDKTLRKFRVLIEWEYGADSRITNMWADVGADMVAKQKLFTYEDESGYATMQRWCWIQKYGDIGKFF